MKTEVTTAIEELGRQFSPAFMSVTDDGLGGAQVIIEPVMIGTRYDPSTTWIGFHITAQYPYADIYPVFIGGHVLRTDGKPFKSPMTGGHIFEERQAIQISRRSAAAGNGSQNAVAKILKVIHFLENH